MNAELNIEDTNAPETVTIDGCVYDAETGEFLGPAISVVGWGVRTREDAEWVLGKMLSAEAALGAIMSDPRVSEARAVLANAEKMAKTHRDRIAGLHRRFDNDLAEVARRELGNSGDRTLKTLLGSISLKWNRGGLRVKDAESALVWAKTNAPDAIKVKEEFQISKLTKAGKEAILASLENPASASGAGLAFDIQPDSETVTIKTGVGAVS